VSDEQTPLSDREMELVRLLATGATNHQIARELFISVNTVKVHLRNIYAKLGVASRTEATMFAVRQGWVDVALKGEEAEPPEEEAAMPSLSDLPRPERWPRVPLVKRIALVVASLLAVMALFLPQVLRGGANGAETDPISGVFPTAPAGSARSRWHTRAQMPTPRTGLAIAAHEDLVYAIGGVSSDGVTAKVEVYDPQADTWTTRNSKPTAVGFVSAVEVGGKIYVPGGIDDERQPRDILEVYDPVQDSWQVRASMPEPLGAYGLAHLDGQIYLFGGLNGQEAYAASVYRYDPDADRWETLQPMEAARGFLSAASVKDRIYVAGGFDGVTEFNTLDAYDPATDTWTSLPPMTLPRGGLAVVAVREHLYVIGGGMDGYMAFNERYDPRVGAWNLVETPVSGQWRGLGVAFVNPHLYAIGGWKEDLLSVNEAYRALYQIMVP
jgi:DNA-binding CsgD family transcriptional regulator/N-acetylneuraminic acid mutarotase